MKNYRTGPLADGSQELEHNGALFNISSNIYRSHALWYVSAPIPIYVSTFAVVLETHEETEAAAVNPARD